MASQERSKPNILFILTDDQGAWAMGCAGNSEVQTPNLDALAASGMRFENFFCTCPVCSPARATILTGKIPSQHGVLDFILGTPGSPPSSRVAEYLEGQTLTTDILAASGYACGHSGKWHLADQAELARKPASFSFWRAVAPRKNYKRPRFTDGERIFENEGYLTDWTADYALEFLDQYVSGAKDSPFYLQVHFNAPHAPWLRELHPEETFDAYMSHCPCQSTPNVPMHPWMHNTGEKTGRNYPEKTYPRDETERRERLCGYYTAITEMDRNVGRLLEALEQYGLRENTLVVFTSDNGMNLGHHGIYGKGNGTFPQNMYDTSVKVPLIVSRPGSVPENRVETGLFSQYDIMPTLLDYVGLENPDATDLPGRSFAPLLQRGTCDSAAPVVVFDEYGPVRMIRTGTWKYVHRYPYGPNELYDLERDPEERYNLIAVAGMDSRAAELKAMLEAWFAEYVQPGCDGVYQPVDGNGQIGFIGPRSQGFPAFFTRGPVFSVRGPGLGHHVYP